MALVYFETTASTLFLIRYDIDELPIVYIFTAFISILLGLLYTKLVENLSIQKLLITTMVFLSIVIFFFYIVIQILNLDFSYMGVMIFKDILWIFAGIEFGIISGILFNIRQNKRLFGLLVSGEILAGILGGFSIGFLIKYMDTSQLLIISGITMVLSFILLLNILKKFSFKFEENKILRNEQEDDQSSYFELFKNNYYLLFFLVSSLAFFVFYFIDYIFYLKVEETFKDEKELANFFGIFIALLNIVNLFSSVYLSGKILSRFGVLFALSIIPIIAIVGTSSFLVLTGVSLGIAFFVLIALKLFNEAFDISILSPTYKVIYQSIPPIHRNKILTLKESIIEPIAMGITGVILLFLANFEQKTSIYISIIVLALLWLVLSKHLKENYILSLKDMLKRRKVFDNVNLLSDTDIQFLLDKLKSSNEMDIIYALDFLEKLENKSFEEDLRVLLKKENIQIRKKVIETISSLNLIHFSKDLEEQMKTEENIEILSLLIHSYCKLTKEQALMEILPFLESKQSLIRNSTIISLIKYCGLEGEKVVNDIIKTLIDDKSEKSRMEVLEIINISGLSDFKDILNDSLKSESGTVKKETIKTIGNIKAKEFIPELLNLLDNKKYKATTIISLKNFKEEIEDELIEEFYKTNIYDKKVSIIKLLCNIKSKKSINFLFEEYKHPIYKHNIIDDLYSSNYLSSSKNDVFEMIDSITNDTISLISQIDNFDKQNYANTYKLLNEEKKRNIESIFKVLSFIYPKDIITQAKVNYLSSSKNFQALAIEILDNIIDNQIKQKIITILENIDKT